MESSAHVVDRERGVRGCPCAHVVDREQYVSVCLCVRVLMLWIESSM